VSGDIGTAARTGLSNQNLSATFIVAMWHQATSVSGDDGGLGGDTQRTAEAPWPKRLAALGDVRPLDHNKDSRVAARLFKTHNAIRFRAQPKIV
jgi:hypothetical protein